MKPATRYQLIKTEYRLKELDDKPVIDFLIDQVSLAYVKTGYKIPDDRELNITIQQFKRYLDRSWPGVKMEWIEKAFERGIEKQYGDYYGVTYVTFIDWMKGFRSNMKREDFGIQEEPMPTKERSEFLLKNRDKLPSIDQLENRGKEALKRKINKTNK